MHFAECQCEAEFGHLLLYDGECFRAAYLHNLPPAYRKFWEQGPVRVSAKLALGRLPQTKGMEGGFTTAIFRQRDKDQPNVHHDILEMPDGQQILLTQVEEGQTATVLQLPAAPKTEKEAEEQKRAEYVG